MLMVRGGASPNSQGIMRPCYAMDACEFPRDYASCASMAHTPYRLGLHRLAVATHSGSEPLPISNAMRDQLTKGIRRSRAAGRPYSR